MSYSSELKTAALAAAFIMASAALPAAALEQDKIFSSSGANIEEKLVITGIRGGIDNPQARADENNSAQAQAKTSLELIPTVEED